MNIQDVYKLALANIHNVGIQSLRLLLHHYNNDVTTLFSANSQELSKVLGVNKLRLNAFINHRHKALEIAHHQLKLLHELNISFCSFMDDIYPKNLKECIDAPIILYYIGCFNLQSDRFLTIVGTRKHSEYGRLMCQKIIRELTPYNPVIISGMAYGIDFIAHKTAKEQGLTTVGVMAHGLDTFYPTSHKQFAKDIMNNGGLISEFKPNTKMAKENFPKRNRILSGISMGTVVIESPIKGGTMITANLANDYNRDVFALPGRVGDNHSEGCNTLIKENKAQLASSGEDIAKMLGWSQPNKQHDIFEKSTKVNLSPSEEEIIKLFSSEKSSLYLDELMSKKHIRISDLMPILLQLEIKGVIKQLPGDKYLLIK